MSPMSRVVTDQWCQEWHETGDPAIRRRARLLRRNNLTVSVEAMGRQVTRLGVIRMSLVDVRRNGADECVWDALVATQEA